MSTVPVERDGDFDREALACLPDVVRFARSLTRDPVEGDDLVQETYLRAYRGHATFRPGSSMRRWLFSICHHAWMRDCKVRRRVVLDADSHDPEGETIGAVVSHVALQQAGVDSFITNLDLGPAIHAAVEALSPVFRSIVLLVDVEGMSYSEVAAVLRIPIGTVRSRLFRARRLLQEQLVAHARDAGLIRPSALPPSPPDR